MPPRAFDVAVRRVSCAAIIDLRGEIDARAEEPLHAGFDQAMSSAPRMIVLNFRDVGYINSTGIALVVGLLAKARQAQCRLVACCLSEYYTEIFQITRLADFIQLFADETSALADLVPASSEQRHAIQ